MTERAELSVGVATLDRPAELARCLAALAAGTRLPAQVVVVDQGSTDAGERVVRAFAGAPMPVVLVRQARRGLSASRNAAAAHARGDLIAVTDDDCVPDAGWVAALERAFAEPSAPAAVSGRVLALGPPEPGTFAVSLRTSEVPREYTARAIPWEVGTGANFAVRREWLARAGGYDERLGAGSPGQAGEDVELLDRLLRLGARVRYEPAAVVYHERQRLARRLSTRASYAHGVGAMCGLWLRRGDRFALRALARYAAMQARALARGVLERDALEVRGRLLSCAGLARGVAYGLAGPRAGAAAGRTRGGEANDA